MSRKVSYARAGEAVGTPGEQLEREREGGGGG